MNEFETAGRAARDAAARKQMAENAAGGSTAAPDDTTPGVTHYGTHREPDYAKTTEAAEQTAAPGSATDAGSGGQGSVPAATASAPDPTGPGVTTAPGDPARGPALAPMGDVGSSAETGSAPTRAGHSQPSGTAAGVPSARVDAFDAAGSPDPVQGGDTEIAGFEGEAAPDAGHPHAVARATDNIADAAADPRDATVGPNPELRPAVEAPLEAEGEAAPDPANDPAVGEGTGNADETDGTVDGAAGEATPTDPGGAGDESRPAPGPDLSSEHAAAEVDGATEDSDSGLAFGATGSSDPGEIVEPDPAPSSPGDAGSGAAEPAVEAVEGPPAPNVAPDAIGLAAHGYGLPDTARLIVRIGGEAFRGDPRYEIVVDGQKVASGRVDWSRETVTEGRYGGTNGDLSDDVVWRDVAVEVPRGPGGIGTVEVRFPNDRYQRDVGDRNLLVDRIEIDGAVIEAESEAVTYVGSKYEGGGTAERMPWEGALVFDTAALAPEPVAMVEPDQAGAEVGRIDVSDADVGETFTYAVSDPRFEIRNGMLKLKDGIALGADDAAFLSIDVAATDSAGHSIAATFDLGIGMPAATPELDVATGFRVEYFDFDGKVRDTSEIDWAADPAHVEVRSEIDFDVTAGSFWEGGAEETFAARVTGRIDVDAGGTYTFRTHSDDGTVLMIDGERVVANDGDHGMRVRTGSIELEPGSHSVELLYFENHGVAGLELEMAGPGDGDFRPLVASDALRAAPGEALTLDIGLDTAGQIGALGIGGLPDGTVLMAGDHVAVAGGGDLDLTGWELDALEIVPPPGYAGEMALTVTAEGTDAVGAPFQATRSLELSVEYPDGNVVGAEDATDAEGGAGAGDWTQAGMNVPDLAAVDAEAEPCDPNSGMEDEQLAAYSGLDI
jgi:hypothetical protein